jgi:hypothetical protein
VRPTFVLALLAVATTAACSKGAEPTTNQTQSCPTLVGPVLGSHCTDGDGGTIAVPTVPGPCTMGDVDAGVVSSALDPALFDGVTPIELDDDECKYHLSFRAACPADSEIGFALTLTNRVDESAATDAEPWMEALLGDTHPAPNTDRQSSETEGGNYVIGPVLFDRAGTWSLELHLYESCANGVGSPHAHATFLVNDP